MPLCEFPVEHKTWHFWNPRRSRLRMRGDSHRSITARADAGCRPGHRRKQSLVGEETSLTEVENIFHATQILSFISVVALITIWHFVLTLHRFRLVLLKVQHNGNNNHQTMIHAWLIIKKEICRSPDYSIFNHLFKTFTYTPHTPGWLGWKRQLFPLWHHKGPVSRTAKVVKVDLTNFINNNNNTYFFN